MCVEVLYWSRPYSQYYKKTTPLAVLGLLWTGAGLGWAPPAPYLYTITHDKKSQEQAGK